MNVYWNDEDKELRIIVDGKGRKLPSETHQCERRQLSRKRINVNMLWREPIAVGTYMYVSDDKKLTRSGFKTGEQVNKENILSVENLQQENNILKQELQKCRDQQQHQMFWRMPFQFRWQFYGT